MNNNPEEEEGREREKNETPEWQSLMTKKEETTYLRIERKHKVDKPSRTDEISVNENLTQRLRKEGIRARERSRMSK